MSCFLTNALRNVAHWFAANLYERCQPLPVFNVSTSETATYRRLVLEDRVIQTNLRQPLVPLDASLILKEFLELFVLGAERLWRLARSVVLWLAVPVFLIELGCKLVEVRLGVGLE